MAEYKVTDTQLIATANAIRGKTKGTASMVWNSTNGFADQIDLISSGGAWAAISVTYPAGSVCTATNGIDTLVANDTSGQVVFGIPEPSSLPEVWTVSCSDSTIGRSDSTTINISTYGQNERITFQYADSILDNNSWQEISIIAQLGIGDSYWDLGDRKAITLNGDIGDYLTLNNKTLYLFIISFNHQDGGVNDNNILFCGFFSGNAVNSCQVCLVDSQYHAGTISAGRHLSFNHYVGTTATNYGGWKGCDLRYDILGSTNIAPEGYRSKRATSSLCYGYDSTQDCIDNPYPKTLMAALPEDFRRVLRLRTHYTNNSGYVNTTPTAVVDTISLLTEYEFRNSSTYSNGKTNQVYMPYYKAGNAKYSYSYTTITMPSSTSYRRITWVATPGTGTYNWIGYNGAYNDGTYQSWSSAQSHGILPIFKV